MGEVVEAGRARRRPRGRPRARHRRPSGAGHCAGRDAAEVVEEDFTEGVADEEEAAEAGGLEGERGGVIGDGPAGGEFDEGDGGEFGEGGLHDDEVALGADVAGEEGEGDEDHRQQAGGKAREGLRVRRVQAEEGAKQATAPQAAATRNLSAGRLWGSVVVEAGEVFEVAELLFQGELGFAVAAVAEDDGDFGDAMGAALDEEFQGDFVADGVEGSGLARADAAEGEEAGHGVADGADEGLGEEGGAGAVEPAEEGPVFGFAAGDVARADDEVGVGGEGASKGGDGFGGVGEVGIHDDDVVVLREIKAGDDGGGQAAVLADEIADFGGSGGEVGEDLGGWSGELSSTTMSSQIQPRGEGGGDLGDETEGCRLP